jgi:predicted secreted protein
MEKILFAAHCVLNTASKVVMDDSKEMRKEAASRKKLLKMAIERDIQFIQLPCPEFTVYGAKRWGHVSDQFDNPFFRKHCKKLLELPLSEMEEYLANPHRFRILGLVGIEGSPTCGVNLTCTGPWGGSKSTGPEWAEMVDQCKMVTKSGVLIQVLKEELAERGIDIPIYGLDEKGLEEIENHIKKIETV